jgi:hypothetical protein
VANAARLLWLKQTLKRTSRKGDLSSRIAAEPRPGRIPVVANGRLYLRDQENLLCYDIKQAGTSASK